MSIIEDVKESAPLIKLIFTWASKTMLGRLALMAIVGLVTLGGASFYNSLQVEKYAEESQLYRAKVEYTDQSNTYQKTLDYINLCINAPKAPQPFVGGSNAHSGGLGGFLDPQAVVNSLNQKGSTARGKTGMFMQVHPRLLEGLVGRTSRIPGMPRMNNLLSDHS